MTDQPTQPMSPILPLVPLGALGALGFLFGRDMAYGWLATVAVSLSGLIVSIEAEVAIESRASRPLGIHLDWIIAFCASVPAAWVIDVAWGYNGWLTTGVGIVVATVAWVNGRSRFPKEPTDD